MLTTTEVQRLFDLAGELARISRETAAMLRMPLEEQATGDLEQLVYHEWSSLTQDNAAQLAFCLVQIETVMEQIDRREHDEFRAAIRSASASLANRLHPRGAPGVG